MGNEYDQILTYHTETKHSLQRYARSAGFMDWENQPSSFRFYQNAPRIELPLGTADPQGKHLDLFVRNNNQPLPFSRHSIGKFLELSLGLSAWKQSGGSKWVLRMNPSSGNLHPTESHLILPETNDLRRGIYHYNAFGHYLAERCILPEQAEKIWTTHYGTEGFFIALSSIFWRDSWKYGERAFRYCHLDVGHALAALSFAANLLGWKISYLPSISDDDLEKLIGFDRTKWRSAEQDEVDCLCYVHSNQKEILPGSFPEKLLALLSTLQIQGIPEPLSQEHIDWQIIEQVASATRKGTTDYEDIHLLSPPCYQFPDVTFSGAALIRRRRSGVDFDRGKSTMGLEKFLAMLAATLPCVKQAPFDIALSSPHINLLLFVHRVEGMAPGLYLLIRNQRDYKKLKDKFHSSFLWEKSCDELPLFLLMKKDMQFTAKEMSCGQDIAGDSTFSLAMLSFFDDIIASEPYRYKQLFWEAGIIGQVLYLQAEAYGFRGTGVGCFLDDSVHQLVGLQDLSFQSLYHFTVGYPLIDKRLQTLPAYHHLPDKFKENGACS